MYLRQVDVPGVDTKFIERHRGVLTELLDAQLDPSRVDAAAPDFAGRYGFLRKPGYVRFRVAGRFRGFSELSVRADEFTAAHLPGVTRAYVVENEITYLAFPLPADAIVIFGGGYAVAVLEPLGWLADLDVVYWGDIDTHGFAILNRLRHRFPHARSMLMDRATLLAHRDQWVTEPLPAPRASLCWRGGAGALPGPGPVVRADGPAGAGAGRLRGTRARAQPARAMAAHPMP